MQTQNHFGIQVEQSLDSQAQQRLNARIAKMKAEVHTLKTAPSGTRQEDMAAKARWESLEGKIASLSGRTHERAMALQDEINTIQAQERAATNAVLSEFNDVQAELEAAETARNERIDSVLANVSDRVPGALTKSEIRRITGRLLFDDGIETDAKGRKFARVEYGSSGLLRVMLNSEGTALGIMRESKADADGE